MVLGEALIVPDRSADAARLEHDKFEVMQLENVGLAADTLGGRVSRWNTAVSQGRC